MLKSKDENRKFMSVFSVIVRDLMNCDDNTDLTEVTRRFANVLQYNVPNGEKSKGLAVVAAYKMMESPENLTLENIRLANILGWCVEMLQSFFLINGDVIDSSSSSETRHELPCWYKNKGVGMQAVIDSLMIESGIDLIIKKYFSTHNCYVPTLELFHDSIFKTTIGQSLNTIPTVSGKPRLDRLNIRRYNAIVKYKTTYSLHMPILLSMYLAERYDPELHRQAKEILSEIGHYFQIQNDFFDCFGDPKTRKTGRDIACGKCSWLVVVAFQRATPAQKQILENHYGRSDQKSVAAVRNVYEELGLSNTYFIYKEELFNSICTHIQEISKDLPRKLFFELIEKFCI